ncbi:hypothetical protein H5407_18565 [Mitsuaria sp. WAJ17]|uniref:hypothetical protein n=1 Tax=Mitsuaria sp. WAJ17 TaxID=2761452 RepID=UPI001600DB09|nr:hypothetical protein [Mitsuaria sp. WAJ17]MBB2487241.1 hypothetical protein [Mitsuaria sp. WAJ17]
MSDHPMPVATRPDPASEHRSAAQSQLDHLFRHALKEEQVSPLYFLLQRFRAKAEEGVSP